MIDRLVRLTEEDMHLFAAASGDISPLHTDPAFARRTAFGACIVYGGLETLAMLGQLPTEALARVRSVSSSFSGPVLPGEALSAQVRAREDRPVWEVRLLGRGKLVARMVASAVPRKPPEMPGNTEPGRTIEGEYRTGPELAELTRRCGLEAVDPAVIEGVVWASHVVGMSIPGFDGLCAAVTIVAGESDSAFAPLARERVVLRAYDERTDRLVVDGTLADPAGRLRSRSVIECFPFAPTPLPESAALPATGELARVRGVAVVIGASRGLGAALSLALLAAGYVVHGVYARSGETAAELAGLAGAYADRLTLHRLDAGDPKLVAELAERIGDSLDGIAVCAAPPALPSALTGELTGYVTESLDLAVQPLAAVLSRLRRDGGWVMLGSSPAATAPLRDLPQLTVAKAALEGLAGWLALAHPGLRVVVVRPPRMRTDLANTPAARASAVEPQAVAAALVQRLHHPDLPRGMSMFEPAAASLAVPAPVPA